MTSQENTAPAIGQQWPGQGGIYAGLARGRNGEPDYHLIVARPELARAKWGIAVEAAAKLEIDGHTDFVLPSRAEQSLMFANVPELFEEAWYWSGEERASDPDSAWLQFFDLGDQSGSRKSGEGRACAIRRLKNS